MPKSGIRPTPHKTVAKNTAALTGRDASNSGFDRIEFHRNAIALMPAVADKKPGVAILNTDPKFTVFDRTCSCGASRNKTCAHLKELAAMTRRIAAGLAESGSPKKSKRPPKWGLADDFENSFWYRLASFKADDQRQSAAELHFEAGRRGDLPVIGVFAADGSEWMAYLSAGADASRFLERCGPAPAEADRISRGVILNRLMRLTLAPNERMMLEQGYKTRGMALRQSFWYALGYHGYREFGPAGGRFCPAIDSESGDFAVTFHDAKNHPVFRTPVARTKVKAFLRTFKQQLSNAEGLPVQPVPLDLIFDVKLTAGLDLTIEPALRLIQKNGEYQLLKNLNLKRFKYGDLVFIPELNMLADMGVKDDLARELRSKPETVISQSHVPRFLAAHREAFENGRFNVDDQIRGLQVFTSWDAVEVATEETADHDPLLTVHYRFGQARVPLPEILTAKKTGQRYIGTVAGWVDCQAEAMDSVDPLLDLVPTTDSAPNPESAESAPAEPAEGQAVEPQQRVRFRRQDLLRLKAVNRLPLDVIGSPERVQIIENLINLMPAQPLPADSGLTSPLRDYQQIGTQWLWFLLENRFGGLLCDDMGLGKTHQIMALMLALRRQAGSKAPFLKAPFLVVAPTTVLSHWHRKIGDHAPQLSSHIYHGSDRDLDRALKDNDVLITSYGLLRRDIKTLSQRNFGVAVFDEIQYLKNTHTKAYQAARTLTAEIKLGLTGTPVENNLGDLKALLDLAVPGYLGSDDSFRQRYMPKTEDAFSNRRRAELRRMIHPFTLRRLKSTVLDELPPKIEDSRTCVLSGQQHALYLQTLEERRRGMLKTLRNPHAPVPYIHIFSLLNLLKQICNHPALARKDVHRYEQYESGKWDLFKELLSESIDSGQKVVVYSQFLGMIAMIKDHLEKQGIGAEILTGQSRRRGEIIERFNTDPDCRVFVGSLRAGGTGIDLVAASVVIHYDRWWNAAKEDQATDRVHRIGQTRGVQVFKLITEDTLEEKIDTIIAGKRKLMESVVREDDPGLLKTFTREELIEMLGIPAGT